jgi:alpha-mannosidase/mannosylglycerate hydrolase
MSQRQAHYVLSTHWDREWYQTFQDYRFRLVRLIDRVLKGWETEDLQGPFQMDGQVITVEDYLEIRPERRQQVEKLIQNGKFILGPWYVLPDEFLVSGESIIRNIRLGGDIVRQMGGKSSKAGFMCDMFGHNSQMPQIFAGFNIPAAFIWRGINIIDQRLVQWKGADGTVIPSYRFGHNGYCTYSVDVRRCRPYMAEPTAEEYEQRLDDYLKKESTETQVGPLLIFDGCDHLEWDPVSYQAILKKISNPDLDFRMSHSSLDEYSQDLLKVASQIEAKLEGELREPGLYPSHLDSQWLIPGVLSSRVWIKQANARCQDLLCLWAEPLSVASTFLLDQEYPIGYLNTAWKWLITNHPHDSMCGCSIDAVHEDMRYRFNQCERIANRVAIEKMRDIAANINGQPKDDDLRLVVFNPAVLPYQQTGEVTLMLPDHWPTFNEFFGFEPKPAFKIFDWNGKEISYQRLSQEMGQKVLETYDTQFPQALKRNAVRVSFMMDIPPVGFATYTVRPGEGGIPSRYPEVPGMATSEASMENEYNAVAIEPNGSLTITDKRTGAMYKRAMTFEDCADIGDGWYHGMAVSDQVYTSTASRAAVSLVHNGPLLTTYLVRVTMEVPSEFIFEGMKRSNALKELVIDNLVSLRPGSDVLEIETIVHNNILDHRLRVLFPSGVDAETYLSDTPFDVVERHIPLRKDNYLYRELEVETKPQQSWTAIYNDGRGLAVVAPGLMETAIRDLPEKPLALTLLRATRRTVMTNGEPLGQLQGDHHFSYQVVFLTDAPERNRLSYLGQRLGAGIRDVQMSSDQVKRRKMSDGLPQRMSFFKMTGAAVLTSLQILKGKIEVRLFNPCENSEKTTLDFTSLVSGKGIYWQRVNFESDPMSNEKFDRDAIIQVELKPKQIQSLAVWTA